MRFAVVFSQGIRGSSSCVGAMGGGGGGGGCWRCYLYVCMLIELMHLVLAMFVDVLLCQRVCGWYYARFPGNLEEREGLFCSISLVLSVA